MVFCQWTAGSFSATLPEPRKEQLPVDLGAKCLNMHVFDKAKISTIYFLQDKLFYLQLRRRQFFTGCDRAFQSIFLFFLKTGSKSFLGQSRKCKRWLVIHLNIMTFTMVWSCLHVTCDLSSDCVTCYKLKKASLGNPIMSHTCHFRLLEMHKSKS